MANINIKGFWIPVQILLNQELNDKEKIILSLILFFSREKNCFDIRNEQFSELVLVKEDRVSRLVSSLKEKGYLNVKYNYSEFWKAKDSYRRLQGAFYKYVTENGFELKRGVTSERAHLSVKAYKEITNFENAKITLKDIKIELPKVPNITDFSKLTIKRDEKIQKNIIEPKDNMNFEKHLEEQLKDEEFKKEWEDLQPEYSIIDSLIKARLEQGITQKQLSEMTGIQQSNISRLESGNYNTTINFLKRLAKALGKELYVEFK